MTNAITVSLPVTAEMISNIFITAIEGGIGYWCQKLDLRQNGTEVNYQNAESFTGQWVAKITMVEDDGTATITPEKLAEALAMRPTEAAQIITDDGGFDADSADILIQCAAFGEIVYG
jgi:hypothetical protein